MDEKYINMEELEINLMDAAFDLNLETVQYLVENSDYAPRLIEAVFLKAVLRHQYDVMVYLMEQGANVNAHGSIIFKMICDYIIDDYNNERDPTLHTKMFKYIIEHGSKIYRYNNLYKLYCSVGNYEMLAYLITHGFSRWDIFGTAYEFCHDTFMDMISYLVQHNIITIHQLTSWATHNKNRKIISLLINNGFGNNVENDLSMYIMANMWDNAQFLINNGIDVSNIMQDSIDANDEKTAEFILSNEYVVFTDDNIVSNTLLWAIRNNNWNIIHRVLDYDPDITRVLDYAYRTNNVSLIIYLLDNGAGMSDDNAQSLLRWAANNNHWNIVHILNDGGVNLDALILDAVNNVEEKDSLDRIRSALDNGANVFAINENGQSVFDIAIQNCNCYESIEFLRNYIDQYNISEDAVFMEFQRRYPHLTDAQLRNEIRKYISKSSKN